MTGLTVQINEAPFQVFFNDASFFCPMLPYLGVVEIEGQPEPSKTLELEHHERQAGIIYPRMPKTRGLAERIESELAEWGIMILWFDQPRPPGTPDWRVWQAFLAGKFGTCPQFPEVRPIV